MTCMRSFERPPTLLTMYKATHAQKSALAGLKTMLSAANTIHSVWYRGFDILRDDVNNADTLYMACAMKQASTELEYVLKRQYALNQFSNWHTSAILQYNTPMWYQLQNIHRPVTERNILWEALIPEIHQGQPVHTDICPGCKHTMKQLWSFEDRISTIKP